MTLFALANGAVSAVKAGCKLYKDIKGAAGEVKDVLKDMDEQFKKLHPADKPATVEQKNAFIKQKNEVIELNRKANNQEHTGIYTEIGEKLGEYYDNFYKCQAIFEEEERRAENEVYTGDASLGKRALQRVLMRKQLEQMSVDLRELMVYQSPPELGALWSQFEEMREQIEEEQKLAREKQAREDAILQREHEAFMAEVQEKSIDAGIVFVGLIFLGWILWQVRNQAIARASFWHT